MKAETSKGDKKSSIEQSALVNEIIKRDNKFFRLNKNFHLDLTTLKTIPEKPCNMIPVALNLEEKSKKIPNDILDKIKFQYSKNPNEKYKWPMTHNQEFGWDINEGGLNTNPRMAKVTSDVVKYADYYYAMNGKSPYATKEISSKGGEGKK